MKSFVAASALATMAMLPGFGASQSAGTDFAPKMKAYLAKAAKGDHHNDDVNPVGRAVLSYLGECAGADLQLNTCIASAFVNITFADGPDGEPTRRFLESEDGEDCDPPTTNEVRQVVREAKDRCPASSRSESKTFLQSMITIVKDDACMTSICDEEVMGRIVFGVFLREQLLPCSGFDHTLDGCVVDQVADQFVNSSNDTWCKLTCPCAVPRVLDCISHACCTVPIFKLPCRPMTPQSLATSLAISLDLCSPQRAL